MQIELLKPPKKEAGLRPCHDHEEFAMIMTFRERQDRILNFRAS